MSDARAEDPAAVAGGGEPASETRASTGRIATPCAVVVSTGRSARGRSVVVGWTGDGLPAATTRMDGLSQEARRGIDSYRAAGLPPRRVPYTTVVPVTYALTGPAVDFTDTADRRAEDQVRYTVVDAHGERREIGLGERGALGAISEAAVPWQAVRRETMAQTASSAVALYTVFAPMAGAAPDTGLAILFEPTLRDSTNEPAFRSFVRNTVSRLLVLDESQPPRARKGYLEVAGRVAGTTPGGGPAAMLTWLRRIGVLEFDDQWLRSLALGRRRMEGRLVRALRAVGLVQVDEAVLQDLLHPRPDYAIDPLSTERLVELADHMYRTARKALG